MLLKLPLNQQNPHELRLLPPSLWQQELILEAVPGVKEKFVPQKRKKKERRVLCCLFNFLQEYLWDRETGKKHWRK